MDGRGRETGMDQATPEDTFNYLEAKETQEGSLPGLLEFYKHLLRIQIEATIGLTLASFPAAIEDGRVDTRRRGLPLMDPDDLLGHVGLLEQTFQGVARCFAQYPALFGNVSEIEGTLTSAEARTWLESSELPSGLACSGVRPDVLQVIVQSAFQPLLSHYARLLLPRLDQPTWRRNYCPVCAGHADFAFLDKEESRWLMCSRCDAAWLFQRLECPSCGTVDQEALSFFTDDEGRYRLYVCEKCKRYLKAVNLRQGDEEVPLQIERLYTLELDVRALQLGYSPPVLTLPLIFARNSF